MVSFPQRYSLTASTTTDMFQIQRVIDAFKTAILSAHSASFTSVGHFRLALQLYIVF